MDTTSEIASDGDGPLLARAAGGDRAAFAALYDRHVRGVYWQAYAVVHDPIEAEDITQDVFITAWRKVRTISLVDDSVLPWLLVTSRFTALNAGRRAQQRRHDALADDLSTDHDVEEQVEAGVVRAEIDKAVAGLSSVDRQLYHRCVEGGETYATVAADLGVTHSVVRNRLSRLRSRLRADLRSIRETA